ncbi:MAG: glycosyltransferase family 2 protein [Planctomycetales bacterium]|nr:glycosyltransferase family 2 protein [Planctomycetales bacterium]
METVYVVIPYFQREQGILQKALRSVAAQQHFAWHVIVADDESPISAESELAGLSDFPKNRITIVAGCNGGPAVARNRGLAAVPLDGQFVAFLDSDDTWSPDHLSNALAALNQGYDFYFADLLQLSARETAFLRAGRITPSQHPSIEGHGLHEYSGDLFHQTLTGNVIGTPTVVYRFDKFRDVRFQEALRYAGEDYLFWMELQVKGAHAAFSEGCEAICGRGVNVFAGSGWGTEKSLDRIVDEIAFNKSLPRIFQLSDEQRRFVRDRLSRVRRNLAMDILHRFRHKKIIKLELLRKLFEIDKKSLVFLLPNILIESASARLKKRSFDL